jgi:ATP/maltotriose-dependent transcriptional regulator MalT
MRKVGEPFSLSVALANSSLVLAATGRYAEMAARIHEVDEISRRAGMLVMTSRGLSMAAGPQIELWRDDEGERYAHEALEVSRAANSPQPGISAAIDLALLATRRGNLECARTLVGDIEGKIAVARGGHGWLWKLRLAFVRARIALAAGDAHAALDHANDCLSRARDTSRVKYVALALNARADALECSGDAARAMEDSTEALRVARETRSPALTLQAMAEHLRRRPDEALRREAKAIVERIADALGAEAGARWKTSAPVSQIVDG